jgi:mono/diheme cytochrome c family protein
VLKTLVILLAVLLVIAAGAYLWASMATSRALSRTIETHRIDFPIPVPIDDDEAAALGLDAEARRELARTRAIERGRHLVQARYVCVECHGQDFGGGVMIDAFPIGTLLGPNLTTGQGSRTANYTAADWDRIVRHGVLPDGRPAVMPSEDFQLMSDRELSDVVMYLRSFPPVDDTVPTPSFGPLGKFLVATGQLHFSADQIASHDTVHPAQPPVAEASAEFGRHLTGICMGCHQPNLAGGPIVGGDPSWPPARNLTPHPDALGRWTYDHFVRAMREGVRPDGTALLPPMTLIAPYAQNMTDIELQAMWAYLRTLPSVAPAGN